MDWEKVLKERCREMVEGVRFARMIVEVAPDLEQRQGGTCALRPELPAVGFNYME